MDRHLGFLQFEGITNRATMNSHEHVCYLPGIYLGMKIHIHSVLADIVKQIPKMIAVLYTPTSSI